MGFVFPFMLSINSQSIQHSFTIQNMLQNYNKPKYFFSLRKKVDFIPQCNRWLSTSSLELHIRVQRLCSNASTREYFSLSVFGGARSVVVSEYITQHLVVVDCHSSSSIIIIRAYSFRASQVCTQRCSNASVAQLGNKGQ